MSFSQNRGPRGGPVTAILVKGALVSAARKKQQRPLHMINLHNY